MTLALILLSSILGGMSARPMAGTPRASDSTQAAPASPTSSRGTNPSTSDQGNQSQPSSQSSSKPAAAQQPSSPKKPAPAKPRKKKVTSANCDSSPSTGTSTATTSNSATTHPPSAGSDASATAASAPKNCPPSKIIVRQGGTSEPAIQLAGGAVGDQATNQRDSANQMLGSTEANLKKLAGQQLSPSQQDMVTQVRQFMEQSKTAVSAGDLERARTLAWKAQLLSEELVKPAK
jgi:hypothetical protein